MTTAVFISGIVLLSMGVAMITSCAYMEIKFREPVYMIGIKIATGMLSIGAILFGVAVATGGLNIGN